MSNFYMVQFQQAVVRPQKNQQEIEEQISQMVDKKKVLRSLSKLSINEQNYNTTQASTNISYTERRSSFSNDQDLYSISIEQQRQYQQEIRKEIMCKVCFSISEQLYSSNCCQEFMCLECNKKIQQCPTYKKNYTLNKNVTAYKLVSLLKQCICRHNECRYTAVSIFKLYEHEKNCEHKIIKCTICEQNIKDKDFMNHLTITHQDQLRKQYSQYEEDY